MTDELLPCPWCGEPLREVSVSEGTTFRWRKVDGCCADGPEVRVDTIAADRVAAIADADRRAIEAWNRRPPAVPVAELEALQRHELPYSGLGDGACGSGNDGITACAEGSLVRWPDLAALIAKYPA